MVYIVITSYEQTEDLAGFFDILRTAMASDYH